MAVCSTCGNQSGLPCGCSQTSLTTSCHPSQVGCSSIATKCAEAYCMECVQPCTKEDAWSIETNNGITFTAGRNDSLTQIFQQFLLSQSTDNNTFNTMLIPLFYVSDITYGGYINFHWNYTGTATITGFRIRYRPYDDSSWTDAIQLSNPAASAVSINYVDLNLVSGITYVFQINTIIDGNPTNATQAVDVHVTIP